MPETETSVFYQLYFQKPGVAEAEFNPAPRETIRRGLYSASGDAPRGVDLALSDDGAGMIPRNGGFLTRTIEGLNWYRNIDRNWELVAPFPGMPVTIPALYVAGDRDLVVHFKGADQLIRNLAQFVPDLRRTIMLEGCGHWTQQERASEVNAAMIRFLKELG